MFEYFFAVGDEVLQSLYSLFGVAFFKATELLEEGKITLYQTPDASRELFKLANRNKHYTIFPEINFCHCLAFRYQVLESETSITCNHVLAAALARITNNFKLEVVTDLQFTEMLNDLYQS